MAATSTSQRSTTSSQQSSPHSSNSSSSSAAYYDFSIELDKTLSSSLWIEFMEWSQNMDVIALVMHQSNNDTQHLWLQRCVGKWQNLLSIDLSQEFDDSQTKAISIAWRYDGNGVCLGLSNGEVMQFLIENSDNNTKKIIKSEIHNTAVTNIEWVMDHNDNQDNVDDNNTQNEDKYDSNYLNTSNYDNIDNLFRSESNLNDINSVMQNNEALLSCTQLNVNDYHQNEANIENIHIVSDTNDHLLNSLTFIDETNKFLSKIPSLPKPPRIDFRYKIDSNQNTLQHIMKKQCPPPIPRKSQPNALSLLVTSDTNEIKLYSSGSFCVGTIHINELKPSQQILKEIDDDNGNKSNLQNAAFHITHIALCNNLQCINSVISSEHTNDLWLRFVHCPILHSRRNELLIITNHGDYMESLLDILNKLERHLMSRWAMGVRSIKGKIAPLQENMETYNMDSTWQHEFKHNLLIGSPSAAFLQYVQQNLNVTALQRGYKQFDQFVNEMLDIVEKNLVHVIQELIFRCSQLEQYALWMERFGCLGLKPKKISTFIDKLSALYIKLDQLQILITDSKLNLTAFKDYLMFLSSVHNNEDNEFNQGFDKLNPRRIFAAIDHDLEPNRVSLFLQNALLPKKNLIIFSVDNNCTKTDNNTMLDRLLSKIKKKWKRFERYSFSYLVQDIKRSWKPILNVLSGTISRSFEVEHNEYGLLYVSSGLNKQISQYIYHPVDHKKDIVFITTDVFGDIFGVKCDVNLCVLTAKRTSLRTNQKQSKLVFIAIIPEMENIKSKIILSNDIWTDDFDEFQSVISEFPVQASINDIKICVVDIDPFMEDDAFNFDAIDIVQIKFVNRSRLAVLAKLRAKGRREQTCLFTINFKKTEFEFQGNRRFNDYEMGINEMAFDFGIIPTQININDTNRYLFGTDVDGHTLSVGGPRKLAAISCDPCVDNQCNRLIVLDINVDNEGSDDDDDEEEDEDDENKNTKDDNEESYSDDNEDSDLRKIIDVD